MSAPGILSLGGEQGPAGPPGSTGPAGHGSTTLFSAISLSVGIYRVPIVDGTAFNNGNYIYITDGTNSLFGPINTGGGSGLFQLQQAFCTVTGDPTLIPNGTLVTWRGQTGPTGPAASPAFVGILGSAQLLTNSFADVINTGSLIVGAGGNVLLLVYFSVGNVPSGGHGADVQILDGASVIMPKNNYSGQPTTGVHTFNTVLITFPLMAYETGLVGGSSHTFAFQAKSFDGSSCDVVDAILVVWTW